MLSITGEPLTAAQVRAVARDGEPVHLADAAAAAMQASADQVARLGHDSAPHYGVSTGFGALANTRIPPDRRAEMQSSLVRSHAAGAGPPVEVEVVRAMLLVRARTLATGITGARPELARALLALLAAGITPLVPEFGSLGCSGDLAPLAHAALALLGEGQVLVGGAPGPAGPALAAAGLAPVRLGPKEGLALLNGTDGITGMLALAVGDLAQLLTEADLAAALSVEALLGTDAAFAADLLALRPQVGQQLAAANMRAVLAGSPIVASHRTGDSQVQDAYSLRCAPQVAGAGRDALAFAEQIVGRELAAAIDNPVVLPDGRVESAGNFHGAPLGYAADLLAIAAADLASISERRTDRLLDPARSRGLPPFLAADPGVHSGLMIAQYTAAALVADCRRLAVPASADSIPTSAMQEDHVSMAWAAARKLRQSLANLRRVLAIEILAAARAVELRAPLTPGAGGAAVLAAVREVTAGVGADRQVAPEIAAVEQLLAGGVLVGAVAAALGPLH